MHHPNHTLTIVLQDTVDKIFFAIARNSSQISSGKYVSRTLSTKQIQILIVSHIQTRHSQLYPSASSHVFSTSLSIIIYLSTSYQPKPNITQYIIYIYIYIYIYILCSIVSSPSRRTTSPNIIPHIPTTQQNHSIIKSVTIQTTHPTLNAQ